MKTVPKDQAPKPEAPQKAAENAFVIKRKRRSGFSLVELLVAVGILSSLAAIALYGVSSITSSSKEQKLKADTATLNSAIRVYEGNGGNLSDVKTEREVLGRLKTASSNWKEIAGLRKGMVDASLDVEYADTRKKGDIRARWDINSKRFVITNSGRGVSEFVINGELIEDLTDKAIYKEHAKGHIGLQVHGIGKKKATMDVAWKNRRIREITSGENGPKGDVGAKVLFDGSHLDAFQATKWKIEDGTLARVPKAGYIWTKETFGDFVLNLEFKVSAKCNSGVFFRTNPEDPVQGGFEIQVTDSYGKAKPDKHDAGALYDALAPSINAIKEVGAWNTMQIEAIGPKITVTMNGEKVIEANLDEWTSANKNPDGTKNKFKTALKDQPRTGYIGFQDHGHDVWYRNVTVTPK